MRWINHTGMRRLKLSPMSNAPPPLIQSLARLLGARLVETHISWLLLAPHDVYKLKKPVHLPFVDYSTLAARQHFCAEEVRLNQRLAPTLYRGVVRICGTAESPVINGDGPVLDHAVHMRRFADGALFSERLAAGTLTPADVDALAALLGGFHAQAPRAAPDSGHGQPAQRRAAALAALDGVAALAGGPTTTGLRDWLTTQADSLAALWQQRLDHGHIRECHGDLHLDNLVCLPDGVAAFDCIEFDAGLRWIDTLDDIAFAVMDFAARGRPDLAFRLLNAWLDHTGDHAGLAGLRFAVVYRALVRALVAALRGLDTLAARYLATALAWTQPGPVQLTLMHGLPGSGKTHVSQRLLQAEGAIRLRSDVERKRLAGLHMLDNSRAQGLNLYDTATTRRTYDHVLAQARTTLQAGWPVILDAAFLRRDERDQACALARACGVPLGIVHCEAPLEVLHQRLQQRQGDASEADSAVLARLAPAAEPLAPDELALLRTPPHND